MSSMTTRLPPRQFKTERIGERKPFKPKPWSHQRELEALRGKTVEMKVVDFQGFMTGTLLEADQFALKLRLHTVGSEYQPELIIYKSSIRSFRAV